MNEQQQTDATTDTGQGDVVTRHSTEQEKISYVTDLLSQDEGDAGGDHSDGRAEPGSADRGEGVSDEHAGGESDPAPGVAENSEGEQENLHAEGVGGDAESDAAPTLKSLAEHLEVEPADLYELEVPLGDGATATLGELKDWAKGYGPVQEAEARLKTERDDFERVQMQTRSEINALMGIIPPHMREQLVREAQQRNSSWVKEQEQAVLEAIPDWRNPESRAADRAGIVALGQDYGYSEAEITHTQDARTLRMLRDFKNMRERLRSLEDTGGNKVNTGKGKLPGKLKSNKRRGNLSRLISQGRAPGATDQQKTAAVSALINSQGR